jgi:prepilin-type N-terminal cleavage/methylation domain-containing protein
MCSAIMGGESMVMRPRIGRERGFTILEIMVVIAIIGILSVISIIQYNRYKERSLNSAVETDLRNAATSQEAYFADQQVYSNNTAQLMVAPYGLVTSEGVNLQVASTTASGYTMIAYHSSSTTTFTLLGPGGSIKP